MAEWSCSGLQSRVRRFNSDPSLVLMFDLPARVAELVDARDLKSLGWQRPCRFESGPGHQLDHASYGVKPSLVRSPAPTFMSGRSGRCELGSHASTALTRPRAPIWRCTSRAKSHAWHEVQPRLQCCAILLRARSRAHIPVRPLEASLLALLARSGRCERCSHASAASVPGPPLRRPHCRRCTGQCKVPPPELWERTAFTSLAVTGLP